MKHPHNAPYGSWRSPITAQLAATSGATLEEPLLDGETLYCIERRPLEGGRWRPSCISTRRRLVSRWPSGSSRWRLN